MGFLQRFLGTERRPGEPEPLRDDRFEETVAGGTLPAFVFFYSLWCSECQVFHGLLNELGPRYADRARFYRMDVSKNPRTPERLGIRGVPQMVFFRGGTPVDSAAGLMPIDSLQDWIEKQLGEGPGAPESGAPAAGEGS